MDYIFLRDGITLLDYQKSVVSKCINSDRTSFGLFSKQGTGKSPMSITIGLSLYVLGKIDKIQVICPSGLKTNFKMEIKKFVKPEFVDVFLEPVSYRDLSYRKEIPMDTRTLLILDESHYLKNPQSKSTEYYFEILEEFYGAILLSGTPKTNSSLDMYMPCKTLGYANEGIMKFINDHCIEKLVKRGKAHFYIYTSEIKNLDKLKEAIEPYSAWIDDKVVLDLPEQNHIRKYYAINKKQRLLLKVASGKIKEEKIKQAVPEVKVLEKHLPAIQLLLDGFMVENGKLKTISTEKTELLMEVINDIPEDEPLVIFCTYHYEIEQISEALKKAKISYVLRTGKSNKDEKDKAVEDFVERKTRVLLGTTSANSEGLNGLTVSSTMIYYSLDFDLKVYAQSLKRIHRIGQERDVKYIYLLSTDLDDDKYKGLDTYVLDTLDVKSDSLQSLFD